MANTLPVLVLHKKLHDVVSNLVQSPKMAATVGNFGATKNRVPFISQCLGVAQSVAAQMPGDCWPSKPTVHMFHWQSMRPHAKLYQQS